MVPLHPARWSALPVLASAWAAYVVFLVVAFPANPLAALAMVGPLFLTGWYGRRALLTAAVGLGHGAALAAVGWWMGAFDTWRGGGAGPALVTGLLMLVSWFTALAGHTVRVTHQLRDRTTQLRSARLEMDADRASVEAIYEASSAGLVAISQDGTVRSWNLAARQIFGHKPEAVLGQGIDRLAAVGDPEDCMGRIRYAMGSQQALDTIGARMRHADGHLLDVEVRGQPVVHPDGDPGYILTIVDRTREHAMERELRAQAALQDRMLQNLDDVIYSVEVPSKQILLVTRNIEKLAGHDADEVTTFDAIADLAHPDDRDEVEKRWQHARAGEQSTLRWRMRCSDGSHTWVEDHVVPARDDDGRVVRVDGIVRRIGRDIELERQAQRMMRWLDAMEPMTGGGAWSLDLRDGTWRWSAGMHRILGTQPAQESLDALRSRLHERSMERLEHLIDDPADLPGPLRIHIHDGHQQRPYVLESWMQRGADGEPIWLYGIVRPHVVSPPPRAPTQRAPAVDSEGPADAGALVVQTEPAAPAQDVESRIREALARSHQAVEAARLAAPPFPPTGWDRHDAVDVLGPAVCDAITDHIVESLRAASAAAQVRRVPTATGHAHAIEPVAETVEQWSQETVRGLCDAILAAQQAALEQRSRQALLAAEQTRQAALREAEGAKQAALAAAESARRAAMQEVAQAQEEAAAQSRRAQEAEKARRRAEEMHAEAQAHQRDALRQAEAAKADALEQVKLARAEALREAEAARAAAERESLRAKESESARAAAEAARAAALQEAEQAKATARKEAGQARAEALQQAEHAKQRAQAIAAEAEKAGRLRDEAEKARLAAVQAAKQAQQRAVREAEQAKAKVLQEAEAATGRVMQQARQAEAAAKQERAKAVAAEQARVAAEKAAEQALMAAEKAKTQALRDAEAARKQALQEAQAARQAAEEAAAQATAAALEQAEQARTEAQQAIERAHDAARQEQAKARRAEEAMARAVQEAEQAKAAALAEAERAKAAALEELEQELAARDAALRQADETQQRLEEAAAAAHAELEALRARSDTARQGPMRAVPTFESVSTGRVAQAGEVELEVTWDDELGWVPRAKGGKDKAQEIKAKSWSGSKPEATAAGPWGID